MSNLTDGERAICAATGISEADFIAARKMHSDNVAALNAQPTEEQAARLQWLTGVTPADVAATRAHLDAERTAINAAVVDADAICAALGVTREAFDAANTRDSIGRSFAVCAAACTFALPALTPGAATLDIQLTPAGPFRPSDNREMKVDSWKIDAGIAAKIIGRFQERKTSPVLDYEHQTLNARENGQPAPAAGWLRQLQWREGSGLWTNVELTATAADFVRRGEYRYVSPVFAFDPTTGEVLAILMAALTNNPAIDGMAPLNATAIAQS